MQKLVAVLQVVINLLAYVGRWVGKFDSVTNQALFKHVAADLNDIFIIVGHNWTPNPAVYHSSDCVWAPCQTLTHGIFQFVELVVRMVPSGTLKDFPLKTKVTQYFVRLFLAGY